MSYPVGVGVGHHSPYSSMAIAKYTSKGFVIIHPNLRAACTLDGAYLVRCCRACPRPRPCRMRAGGIATQVCSFAGAPGGARTGRTPFGGN